MSILIQPRTMSLARAVAFGLTRSYATASKVSIKQRIKDRYNWTFKEQPRMLRASAHLYEASVDNVDLNLWFKHFQLPDTYLSWFFVTELHLWMALTRVMADSQQRRRMFLRNTLIKNLWIDADQRMKKIASIPSGVKRECINDLSDHFNAALCIYDEGLVKDDQALAGALWRVVFTCNPDLEDLRQLRTLVHYVRRNIAYLEDLSFEKFIEENAIEWHSLQESIKATT